MFGLKAESRSRRIGPRWLSCRVWERDTLSVFCGAAPHPGSSLFGGGWVMHTSPSVYACSFMASLNSRLTHTYSQLLRENEVLQTDHKNLKTLLNNSRLEQTRLEAEFSKLKEQYQQLDITSTKLNNQCEVREDDAVFHDWYLCNIYEICVFVISWDYMKCLRINHLVWELLVWFTDDEGGLKTNKFACCTKIWALVR